MPALVSPISPYVVADPRPVGGSMMRIYRDIRFSEDKTPYKDGHWDAFLASGDEQRGWPCFLSSP